MSRRYTLDEIMALKPCYSREELQKYFPKGTITARQITEADVSHSDKLWVLARLLRPEDFVAFACDCAERVLRLFEERFPRDSRPRKAIEAARSGDRAAAEAAARAAGAAEDAWAAWAAEAAAEAAEAAEAAWAAARAARAAEAAARAARAAEAVARAAWAAWAAEAAAEAAEAEHEWQLKKLLQIIHDAEQSGNQPF